jgi:hypothetical protein
MKPSVLLTLSFITLSCAQALQERPRPKPAGPPTGLTINDMSRPKLALDELQPEEVVDAVNATFRLTPDRRFLAAVADVYELSTGRTAPSVDIDFRDGVWRVRCAGSDVGTLPDLPTFEDQMAMLTKWSATLAANAPAATPLPTDVAAAVDRDIDAFDPPHLFSAIDRLSKQTSLDAEGRARAAHAATLLTAQIFDQFDFGDPLRARALALLAIASRENAGCCADDTAVLAWLLGYTTEAEQLGKTLSPSSFAIAFMHGSLSDSNWLTASERLRFVSLTEPPNIFRWPLNIQFAPLLMEVMSFPEQVPIARVEEALILNELETNRFNEGNLVFDGKSDWLEANAARLTNVQRGAVIKRFEAALPSRVASLKTRLLDAGAVRAYYESTFYAAVFKEFEFQYRRFASGETARQFIESLGTPDQGTGEEVISWMNDLVTAKYYGANGLGRPATSLKRLTRIGAAKKAELLQTIGEVLGGLKGSVRSAAAEFYKQLDSRPSEMLKAGLISTRITNDPKRRDLYWQTAVQRAPQVGAYGDVAYYRNSIGDRAGLRALVDDRSASPIERAVALNYLGKLAGADAAFVHRRFEELIEETPEISILHNYATYLNARNEPSIKERIMRRVLLKWDQQADVIGKAWVAASLSDALEREGRYREGYAEVAPYVPVGSANVMNSAASLLQRLGRIQEANDLGEAMIKRYAQTESRADFAAILWHEHRYPEAARLFDPRVATFAVGEAFYSLPEKFAETFDNATAAEAVKAYSALIDADLDESILRQIPQKALDEKKAELAFALAEHLAATPSKTRAPQGVDIPVLLTAYRALREMKGAEAAAAWLQTLIPPSGVMQALVDFYSQGEYDFVQRYAPSAPREKAPEVAALQAAALLYLRVPSTDPRWQRLVETARALPDDSSGPPIAKYLLGIVDERAFFAAGKGRTGHADVEYFSAVKALAERDCERALALMIAASFGPDNYAPQIWAIWQISRWSTIASTWNEIVKECR